MSVDLIGVSRGSSEALRYELSATTGIPLDAVILNFSHIHSGPMTNLEGYATVIPKPPELRAYEDEMDTRLVRAACTALERMRPARVTVHSGRSDVGVNRRNRADNGEVALRPNPDGVYNPDVWVLHIETGDSRCVLFSYGCHPVIVYGFSWDGISADFPGVCRRRLQADLGSGTHCQFIQGLAGNVRPRVLADPSTGIFRKSTPEDPERAGADLARDILEALRGGGEVIGLELEATAGSFLAGRDQEAIPPSAHWVELTDDGDELRRNLGRYWMDRLEAGLPPIQAVPWDIGLLQLAPGHLVAWLSGEPVAEWLGHLRRWLADDRLIAWGYCQHVNAYLPSDELISEGGYEVTASNQHSKLGPGPFATGLNTSAREAFLALSDRIRR
jgi:hypothetical protein